MQNKTPSQLLGLTKDFMRIDSFFDINKAWKHNKLDCVGYLYVDSFEKSIKIHVHSCNNIFCDFKKYFFGFLHKEQVETIEDIRHCISRIGQNTLDLFNKFFDKKKSFAFKLNSDVSLCLFELEQMLKYKGPNKIQIGNDKKVITITKKNLNQIYDTLDLILSLKKQ